MLHNASWKTILAHKRHLTLVSFFYLKESIFNKKMFDLKIFLFENKLSFIFKNFSFDLLLQSTFRTFINSNKMQRSQQNFFIEIPI